MVQQFNTVTAISTSRNCVEVWRCSPIQPWLRDQHYRMLILVYSGYKTAPLCRMSLASSTFRLIPIDQLMGSVFRHSLRMSQPLVSIVLNYFIHMLSLSDVLIELMTRHSVSCDRSEGTYFCCLLSCMFSTELQHWDWCTRKNVWFVVPRKC